MGGTNKKNTKKESDNEGNGLAAKEPAGIGKEQEGQGGAVSVDRKVFSASGILEELKEMQNMCCALLIEVLRASMWPSAPPWYQRLLGSTLPPGLHAT